MSFAAPDAPQPPGARHRWVWWTVGGCGTVFLMAIMAIVIVTVLSAVLTHNLHPTGNCLPAGFPVAPNLNQVTSLHLGSTCTTSYRTNDSAGQVETFYASALNQNGWQITSQSGSRILFKMAQPPQKAGTVTVSSARGGGASVLVILRNP